MVSHPLVREGKTLLCACYPITLRTEIEEILNREKNEFKNILENNASSLRQTMKSIKKKGLLKKIFVEGDHGSIVTMQAGDTAVLTVSATTDTKLGLLFLDMERTANKIANVLSFR